MLRNIMSCLLVIVLLFSFASTTSCSWLTETGNPGDIVGSPGDVEETGDEEDPALESPAPGGLTYENETFGVRIRYEDIWTVDGQSTDSVIFVDGGDEKTSVAFEFIRLAEEPSTLLTYLEGKYPTRTFTTYDTDVLSGYKYDYTAAGSSGGDHEEYYFLNNTVFIEADAEIFTGMIDDVDVLLNGVGFYE